MAYLVQGLFLPKKFFVTSGWGLSPVSHLNAFDAALVKAGISQCNLVYVSSILPPDAEKVEVLPITPGTITFCVMAKEEGNPGESIGAGIGWGWLEAPNGTRYGVVAEAHGRKDEKTLKGEILEKLREMAKVRNMSLTFHETRVEHLSVPENMYGCVLAALIYVPWELKEAAREISKSPLNPRKPNKQASRKTRCGQNR